MIEYSTKYYTGVGSRSTPKDIQQVMTSYAKRLSLFGYTLRSGGAEGADTAFELGALRSQIYLPWKSFNDNNSSLYGVSDKALNIASKIHPAWGKCSQGAKKLHGRNVYQVLGKHLNTPSEFVIYWAEENDGNVQGGTRTAVELARYYNIPTYNLYLPKQKKQLSRKMNKLFYKHAKITLRHMYLFYNEGISQEDDEQINELLNKEKLDKSDISRVFLLFKEYKDLNKNPKYLPTYLQNINN